MRFNEVDDTALLETLKRLIISSHFLGEKNVAEAINELDLQNVNKVETELMADLFNLSSKELIEKWFDGEEEAGKVLL